MLPDLAMRIVVFLLLWLDKVGLMPKFIGKASPWHCSVFLTNIGSIGVESIYHHLYEFGTCSMFVPMGKKSRRHSFNKHGELAASKSILLKFVLDERICDGFYYASSMRMLSKTMNNPASLLTPPEKIIVDEGVGKKRIDFVKLQDLIHSNSSPVYFHTNPESFRLFQCLMLPFAGVFNCRHAYIENGSNVFQRNI